MAATHVFLSAGWIQAALELRDEYVEHLPEPPAPVRMNVVVHSVPDRTDDIAASIDTAESGLLPRLGHLDDPELTVRLDYETAWKLFVDQDPEAVGQAFFAGKIAIEGDMTRLFFLQTLQPNDEQRRLAAEIHERLVALTAR